MAGELKTIKFQMMLSPSEAEAIDDWGFEHRIRSRAEAIRRLVQLGLSVENDINIAATNLSRATSRASRFLKYSENKEQNYKNASYELSLILDAADEEYMRLAKLLGDK